MNLTGQAPYQKGQSLKKRNGARPPNAEESRYWDRLKTLGCIIRGCHQQPGIHHCETGAGGRKDHMKVLPLCHFHHQGDQGIHTHGRPLWQKVYGTEQELMRLANDMLGLP